jgi:uncharacterized protein YjbJ (UPF0337 family)
MGITDKISGKVKQAVGDVTGDDSTRREGKLEERKGHVEDAQARAEERAEKKAEEAADLDRRT